MTEVWENIKDSNVRFQVSNLGNIRHIKRGTVRKLKTNRNGYKQIELRINKEKKTLSVHRLVAFAFVSNPYNKPCINHRDGNKSNNVSTNLQWATYTDNLIHAYQTGLRKRKTIIL